MALPTPSKRYLTATLSNDLLGGDEINQCDLITKVKNKRKDFGNTVAGSSDSSTGAMDGVDRIVTYTNWGTTGTTSWLVMNQPGSHAQDLVAHVNDGQSKWKFAHSPGGLFTGGSASVLPTAIDQSTPYYGTWFGTGDGGTNVKMVCNLWISIDLTMCRQSFWFANNPFGDIWYDTVDEPTVGWAAPNYALIDKNGNAKSTDMSVGKIDNYVFNPYEGVGLFKGYGPYGAMNMLGEVLSSGNGSGTLTTMSALLLQKNKIDGKYRDIPFMGLYEPMGNVNGGSHGHVFDSWWVGKNLFTPGSTAPSNGSNQFVIIGDRMLVWDGTPFQTA